MRNRYKVGKQYGRGPETILDERFNNLSDVKAFVETKLADDAALNVKAIYRIYEDDEVHSEYDTSKVVITPASSQASQGSQGMGSGASFRPTPLNTAPRPAGTPQKWMVDEDEDKDKKK